LKRYLATLACILFLGCLLRSSTVDTAIINSNTPSKPDISFADTGLFQHYQTWINHKSFLEGDKKVVFDVQQLKSFDKNTFAFFLLVSMVGILTYVKLAFGKEMEDLFQSFINSNLSQQIFRAQANEISFPSFLLHANFIIAISLYVQFILVNHLHVIVLKGFSFGLALIFLFTFFYLAKLVALKIIGTVFDVKEQCNEYAFIYSTQCKILGLTLIPAIFVFYTVQKIFFNLIFVFTLLIVAGVSIIIVWRGLSTGIKLMYKSVYHFFIYVCVVEISPIFLLFKLLTKTIP
jgi:hypothetical protein